MAGLQFYLNGIGIKGQNGIPKGLVKDQWLNFGPRIGFAYDMSNNGNTVLRGGFGVMYERIQGNDMYNAGPNQPFSASVTNPNVLLSNPFVSIQTGQVVPTPISVGSITGLAYSDYRSPRAISTASVFSSSFRAIPCSRSPTSEIRTGIRTTMARRICRPIAKRCERA